MRGSRILITLSILLAGLALEIPKSPRYFHNYGRISSTDYKMFYRSTSLLPNMRPTKETPGVVTEFLNQKHRMSVSGDCNKLYKGYHGDSPNSVLLLCEIQNGPIRAYYINADSRKLTELNFKDVYEPYSCDITPVSNDLEDTMLSCLAKKQGNERSIGFDIYTQKELVSFNTFFSIRDTMIDRLIKFSATSLESKQFDLVIWDAKIEEDDLIVGGSVAQLSQVSDPNFDRNQAFGGKKSFAATQQRLKLDGVYGLTKSAITFSVIDLKQELWNIVICKTVSEKNNHQLSNDNCFISPHLIFADERRPIIFTLSKISYLSVVTETTVDKTNRKKIIIEFRIEDRAASDSIEIDHDEEIEDYRIYEENYLNTFVNLLIKQNGTDRRKIIMIQRHGESKSLYVKMIDLTQTTLNYKSLTLAFPLADVKDGIITFYDDFPSMVFDYDEIVLKAKKNFQVLMNWSKDYPSIDFSYQIDTCTFSQLIFDSKLNTSVINFNQDTKLATIERGALAGNFLDLKTTDNSMQHISLVSLEDPKVTLMGELYAYTYVGNYLEAFICKRLFKSIDCAKTKGFSLSDTEAQKYSLVEALTALNYLYFVFVEKISDALLNIRIARIDKSDITKDIVLIETSAPFANDSKIQMKIRTFAIGGGLNIIISKGYIVKTVTVEENGSCTVSETVLLLSSFYSSRFLEEKDCMIQDTQYVAEPTSLESPTVNAYAIIHCPKDSFLVEFSKGKNPSELRRFDNENYPEIHLNLFGVLTLNKNSKVQLYRYQNHEITDYKLVDLGFDKVESVLSGYNEHFGYALANVYKGDKKIVVVLKTDSIDSLDLVIAWVEVKEFVVSYNIFQDADDVFIQLDKKKIYFFNTKFHIFLMREDNRKDIRLNDQRDPKKSMEISIEPEDSAITLKITKTPELILKKSLKVEDYVSFEGVISGIEVRAKNPENQSKLKVTDLITYSVTKMVKGITPSLINILTVSENKELFFLKSDGQFSEVFHIKWDNTARLIQKVNMGCTDIGVSISDMDEKVGDIYLSCLYDVSFDLNIKQTGYECANMQMIGGRSQNLRVIPYKDDSNYDILTKINQMRQLEIYRAGRSIDGKRTLLPEFILAKEGVSSNSFL